MGGEGLHEMEECERICIPPRRHSVEFRYIDRVLSTCSEMWPLKSRRNPIAAFLGAREGRGGGGLRIKVKMQMPTDIE